MGAGFDVFGGGAPGLAAGQQGMGAQGDFRGSDGDRQTSRQTYRRQLGGQVSKKRGCRLLMKDGVLWRFVHAATAFPSCYPPRAPCRPLAHTLRLAVHGPAAPASPMSSLVNLDSLSLGGGAQKPGNAGPRCEPLSWHGAGLGQCWEGSWVRMGLFVGWGGFVRGRWISCSPRWAIGGLDCAYAC